jgi:tRNA threonylcarbamoyl adenosine modification protein (Sua5/YciO/YrdC/YwlC family)
VTQLFRIYPENPQLRLLHQTVAILEQGGVIAYPTDSGYALGCKLEDKHALEKIRAIRQLSDNHNFTLVCKDLSELAIYAIVTNLVFRLLKANTPGPYTFILEATKEVPKRLQHPKRRTIGLRIPANPVAMALLKEFNQPLMSTTLILPGENSAIASAEEIYEKLSPEVDVILDGGTCGNEPTTVIDFASNADGSPRIARRGKGDTTPFTPEFKNVKVKGTFHDVFAKLKNES